MRIAGVNLSILARISVKLPARRQNSWYSSLVNG